GDVGGASCRGERRNAAGAREGGGGLLLDRMPAGPEPSEGRRLLGMSGMARGKPGTNVPITLWWRAEQPPPQGVFTFLHLLDAAGQKVADYNAPLAGDRRPRPWVAAEPLSDQAALALPAHLATGQYRLIAGAFDLASGARLAEVDLGAFVVE